MTNIGSKLVSVEGNFQLNVDRDQLDNHLAIPCQASFLVFVSKCCLYFVKFCRRSRGFPLLSEACLMMIIDGQFDILPSFLFCNFCGI